MEKRLEQIQSFVNLQIEKMQPYMKPFFILCGMYVAGIISIVRANYKYIDDFGRVFEGYKGWNDFSRYTSVLLSPFIHADNYLTDISPVPQLMACVFLAMAGIIVIKAFVGNNEEIKIWHIIAVVPMGLSPYFLECLSYKYDSVYMALSILAAVFPIILIDANLIGYGVLGVAGTIIMLTTYQASSGIFPMLVVMALAFKWSRGDKIKSVLIKLAVSAGSYIVGMGIYKFFIMTEVDEYVSSSIAPVNEIISQFVKYYKQVASDYKTWWLLLILLIAVAYIAGFVMNSSNNKIISMLVGFGVIIVLILLAFGMYPVLSKASYYPRAMYGFGVMCSLICVGAVVMGGNSVIAVLRLYGARLFTVLLAWTLFIFSISYGNNLAEQARYTEFRVSSVINDIKELDMMLDNEPVLIQISGSIGKSPVIRNIPQGNYSILERLVPETFAQEWKWSKYYFYNYFAMKNITEDRSVDLHEANMPVIVDTIYHTVYGDDHKLLIELK